VHKQHTTLAAAVTADQPVWARAVWARQCGPGSVGQSSVGQGRQIRAGRLGRAPWTDGVGWRRSHGERRLAAAARGGCGSHARLLGLELRLKHDQAQAQLTAQLTAHGSSGSDGGPAHRTSLAMPSCFSSAADFNGMILGLHMTYTRTHTERERTCVCERERERQRGRVCVWLCVSI
jgi:hypothetical protein